LCTAVIRTKAACAPQALDPDAADRGHCVRFVASQFAFMGSRWRDARTGHRSTWRRRRHVIGGTNDLACFCRAALTCFVTHTRARSRPARAALRRQTDRANFFFANCRSGRTIVRPPLPRADRPARATWSAATSPLAKAQGWRLGPDVACVYYLPRSVSATDLEVMRRLDRLHLELPFAGSRMLRGLLVAEGCKIGRRHVKTTGLHHTSRLEFCCMAARRTRAAAGDAGDRIS
jgi:hypothetical protein